MGDETKFDSTVYLRPPPEPAERSALLPGLNTAYKASGTVDNDASCLVLIMGKEGFQPGGDAYIVLQYVHLGIGSFGFSANGQVFSFVFSDLQPKLLRVHGRDLLRIYHNIGLRRMPWFRQTDRDFRAVGGGLESEPVITRIEVEDWQPPEKS